MKLLIHPQTPTVAPLRIGNRKVVSSHTYFGCDYLFMLKLKLNHVIKMGPWCLCWSHVRFGQHSVVMSLYNMYQTSWPFLGIHYSQYSRINTRTCLVFLVLLIQNVMYEYIWCIQSSHQNCCIGTVAILSSSSQFQMRIYEIYSYTKPQ